MQHCLILDHGADTSHPGDFMDSTENVLNPTGCCIFIDSLGVLTCALFVPLEEAESSVPLTRRLPKLTWQNLESLRMRT